MLIITLRPSVTAAMVVWLIALLFPFYGKKNLQVPLDFLYRFVLADMPAAIHIYPLRI